MGDKPTVHKLVVQIPAGMSPNDEDWHLWLAQALLDAIQAQEFIQWDERLRAQMEGEDMPEILELIRNCKP